MDEKSDSIENEIERYSSYLEQSTGLPFPTRLIGLKEVLTGWSRTWPTEPTHKDIVERDMFFRLWSKDAELFFVDLIHSHEQWACFFQVGDHETQARSLRKLQGSYALYEAVQLFPGHTYQINYAHIHQVPQDAQSYDLPVGSFSSTHQLYIGDTNRNVAFSLNQLRASLVQGGELIILSGF